MALAKCIDCGEQVSATAKACPKCGRKRPSQNNAPAIGLCVAIAAVMLIWGWLFGDKDEDKPVGDIFGEMACETYTDLAADARAGIVSDDELRGRLQAVYDDAQNADSQEIRESARRLLGGVTSGEIPAGAADDLASACVSLPPA